MKRLTLFISLAIGFGVASFIIHNSPVEMFFASLGASACIIYTSPDSPAAAWYRVLGAHVLCAAIGVAAGRYLDSGWAACAAAEVCAVMAMTMLNLLHPPAAATCLLGYTSGMGFEFVLSPVFAGVAVLLAVSKTVLYIAGLLPWSRER